MVHLRAQVLYVPDWGWIAGALSARGLWALSLPQPDAVTALARVRMVDAGQSAGILDSPPGTGSTRQWTSLVRLLHKYLSGHPVGFEDLPLDMDGYTEFQRAVLRVVKEIPYGSVVSYGDVAVRVGRPGAARAVGQVMRCNRTPIVIP
ncbi:MAG: methylated-DNA--[protein]-cysteine S-methyltransferase [Peptococcaceae bacterium]|nr:methylated-DNA--[protein]-cysteine S-methyltransferase [Peptococcaceae bacterium]